MPSRRSSSGFFLIAVVAASSAAATEVPVGPGAGPPADTAERITLDEAVRRALARNPTLAIARAEVARAEGLLEQARAGWWPTLVGNASYTRLDHDRVLNNKVIAAENQVAGNLVLTVPLVAPQGWTADRRARDARRVAEENAGDVRRLVAQATANAYLSVLAQHRQIRSTEAARANARAHATYAHTRLVGGVGHSIDDVRAQQDLATVEVQLQTVYTGLVRAREALGVLVGGATAVDSLNGVDLGKLPSLPDALEDARTRRPDIDAQRGKVVAAEHARKDVWAYYAPYLAAVGQPYAQVGSALQAQVGWQAQLLLTLPLYDGGLRSGVGGERDALTTEARAGLDASLRQAQSEVRVAFESMLHADQALLSVREEVLLAHKAYDLANLAYEAGATTNLEVIDAAHRARDAEGDASQAEDVARHARLDLLVASGRFP
ncbi:MAG: outer rane efflux protein [Myxococcales bacterium]|nr:outer rane efflux protein [Myxococcales bacterium]